MSYGERAGCRYSQGLALCESALGDAYIWINVVRCNFYCSVIPVCKHSYLFSITLFSLPKSDWSLVDTELHRKSVLLLFLDINIEAALRKVVCKCPDFPFVCPGFGVAQTKAVMTFVSGIPMGPPRLPLVDASREFIVKAKAKLDSIVWPDGDWSYSHVIIKLEKDL